MSLRHLGLAGFLCMAFAALGTAPVSADLLSHWPLDGDFDDVGPGGNDGIFQSFVEPLFVDGYDGTEEGAILLNGVDEYILVEQNDGLPLYSNPQFSVAMWVMGGPQGDKRVWSESTSASTAALFNLGTQNAGATGQFDLFVRDAANVQAAPHLYSNQEPFDGEWHHILWVDDNGAGTLYVDGVADTAIFNYGRPDLAAGDALIQLDTTTIGGILRSSGTCCLFLGAIDDVRIYDHALSASEAAELFAGETLECPTEGDTHCGSIAVDGPAGNVIGTYTFTSTGANDDGGDSILYSFRVDDGAGTTLTAGPQAGTSAEFALTPGTWTVEVTVDDDPLCFDVAGDATCTMEVEVVSGEPMLVGHWTLDGTLEDSSGNENHGFSQSGFDPLYIEGEDGTDPGAVELNGIDDLVVVEQNVGLPLYANPAFTVAMWVRGLPQPDYRVWSEGSTKSNTPLFNIGTDNTGTTGQVDIYIRDAGGTAVVGHVHSQREAFDGDWHHIAWVDDNGNAVLYIDGVPDATNFSYVRPPMQLDTTTIGGILRANPSHWFIGDIDDVRAYNYALTAEEVMELSGPLECPDEGDTHCDDILVEGPAGDAVGLWTFTALDALDDTDDEIWYSWTAERTDGLQVVRGPTRADPIAVIGLPQGSWTVSVFADDDLLCEDEAADARCSVEVEVIGSEEGEFLSHWKFDNNVEDSLEAGNDGITAGNPLFVEGFDGTANGALSFNGTDDYVQVFQQEGLPLYAHENFSIAMWVKGLPQGDRRVWSEGSTVSNTPLFNIGTQAAGTTGQVDIFIRDANGTVVVPHVLSEGEAFDGEWHHIAWVDEFGQARLYIDGVRDPTVFSYNRPEMDLDTTTIGGILRATACCWFGGEIDDVRAYTRALTDEEVAELAGGEPEGAVFLRGNADGVGAINITDGVFVLNYLFTGGGDPPCKDAADADDSGVINITDGVYILNFLFTGGADPRPPFPDCGVDPTDDSVTCDASHPSCI